MPRAPRIETEEEVARILDLQADALDLPVTTLANAIIRGAAQTGQIERLATLALAQTATRRRPRAVVRRWVCLDGEPADGPGGPAPGTWETAGGWMLQRRGRPAANSRNARPDEGWYLTGPGIPEEGVNLGINRPRAQRAADERIARAQAEAPVHVADTGRVEGHLATAGGPFRLEPSFRHGEARLTLLDGNGAPIGGPIPIGNVTMSTPSTSATSGQATVTVNLEGADEAAERAASRLRAMINQGLVTEEEVRLALGTDDVQQRAREAAERVRRSRER